ncbi:MAG: hypothetical protein JXA06_13710 [Bacteroidetes bacterium]|nr:hypothetical protein [Bacteroidota bacterium]
MKKPIPEYQSRSISSRRNMVFKIVTLLISILIFVGFEFSLGSFNYEPDLSKSLPGTQAGYGTAVEDKIVEDILKPDFLCDIYLSVKNTIREQ